MAKFLETQAKSPIGLEKFTEKQAKLPDNLAKLQLKYSCMPISSFQFCLESVLMVRKWSNYGCVKLFTASSGCWVANKINKKISARHQKLTAKIQSL